MSEKSRDLIIILDEFEQILSQNRDDSVADFAKQFDDHYELAAKRITNSEDSLSMSKNILLQSLANIQQRKKSVAQALGIALGDLIGVAEHALAKKKEGYTPDDKEVANTLKLAVSITKNIRALEPVHKMEKLRVLFAEMARDTQLDGYQQQILVGISESF